MYPHFPTTTNDNRYHLQAFRHLYVLAVSHRCLECVDVESNSLCYVPLEITLKPNTLPLHGTITFQCIAPCLVPCDLDQIKSITIVSPRYWNYTFSLEYLKNSAIFFVKKKTPFLDYSSDPNGQRSLLFRTFPKEFLLQSNFSSLPPSPESILQTCHFLCKLHSEFSDAFGKDPKLVLFLNNLRRKARLDDDPNASALSPHDLFFTQALYDCLTHDKLELHILPIYLTLFSSVLNNHQNKSLLNSRLVYNARLLLTFYQVRKGLLGSAADSEPLLPPTFVEAVWLKLNELGLTKENQLK